MGLLRSLVLFASHRPAAFSRRRFFGRMGNMKQFSKPRKLFIPGPSEVKKDTLLSQAKPLINHRGSEFIELHRSLVGKLQSIFNTKNQIFIVTSSGTGVMEGAVRNFIKRKSLHVGGGEFAERWHEIAKVNGKEADLLEVEWGKVIRIEEIKKKLNTGQYDSLFVTHSETSTGVLHPIREIGEVTRQYPDVLYLVDAVSSLGGTEIKIDEWGIDVLVSASQKCLAIPPGLSLAIISEKALKRAAEVESRGYYFDFLLMKKYFDEKGENPITPAITLFYALDFSLDKILKEGIENRYKRHQMMAEYVRSWAERRFSLFPEKGYETPTLTVIKNNKGINVAEMIEKLKEKGFVIANGYGKLKEKTFRIAHMGDLTLPEVKELIKNINEILGVKRKKPSLPAFLTN